MYLIDIVILIERQKTKMNEHILFVMYFPLKDYLKRMQHLHLSGKSMLNGSDFGAKIISF